MERTTLEKAILKKKRHEQISLLHEAIKPLDRYSDNISRSCRLNNDELKAFLHDAIDNMLDRGNLFDNLYNINFPAAMEDKIIEETIERLVQ
jgi:GTP1/Obg family GTP-binding protein